MASAAVGGAGAATGGASATAAAPAVISDCFIGGAWVKGAGAVTRAIVSPLDTTATVADVTEASDEQVDAVCEAAAKAARAWRVVPAADRARVLFRYRELLEANVDALAASVVKENGKLFSEAKGEVRRGIDMVEFAIGAPALLQVRTAVATASPCVCLRCFPTASRCPTTHAAAAAASVVAGCRARCQRTSAATSTATWCGRPWASAWASRPLTSPP